jgi:hypothetical protein
MRFQFRILTLLFLCAGAVSGQDRVSQEKVRAVMIPRQVGLVTIAYQPDCPLHFENVKFLAGVNGGGLTSYDLRNSGTKPIRKITIGDSRGSKWSWNVASQHGPIFPGQLFPRSDEDWIEVVPLTDELRDKLKLRGPLKGLLVLMVIRVDFMDGTFYDDELVYGAMRSYIDDVQTKVERLEYMKNKPK